MSIAPDLDETDTPWQDSRLIPLDKSYAEVAPALLFASVLDISRSAERAP